MIDLSDSFDVCVVGAGPGGIAAAVTAAEAGKRVALIDDGVFAGGQIWRHSGAGSNSPGARQWMARLDAARSIVRLARTQVVASLGGGKLLAEGPSGARILSAESIILATGARELFLPFPGWTTAGVFGAGAIQSLIKSGLSVKGKRVLVAGTGPLLLAVADLLRSKGAAVPMIVEQAKSSAINRFALSLLGTPSKLLQGISLRARLLGTTYATDSYPLRVEQADGRLRATIQRGRREMEVDCDYFACGFNLIPNTELPQILGCDLTAAGFVRVDRRLRTTATGVFAIGELTGIGGVDKALIEGHIAAATAIGNEALATSFSRAHPAVLSFTARLDSAFALRPEVLRLARPDTIICRCEDVPLSAVSRSLNARDAKLQTRCGMGPCQGRVCGAVIQRTLSTEPQRVRAPIYPVSIRTLAATKIEA